RPLGAVQVVIRPEQAAQLRDLLVATDPDDELGPPLVLRDPDGPTRDVQLRAAWSRAGTRLLVTVEWPRFDEPVGLIELRPEQIRKLHRFLDATVPRSR